MPYLALLCATTALSFHPATHAIGGWIGVGIWTGVLLTPLLMKMNRWPLKE